MDIKRGIEYGTSILNNATQGFKRMDTIRYIMRNYGKSIRYIMRKEEIE